MRRVNHRTVARACGVSSATVSRVLSGHPNVSAAVRSRVQKSAAELGYVADARLAHLSRLRWSGDRQPQGESIAVLVDRFAPISKSGPKSGPLGAEARRLGYRLEYIAVDPLKTTSAALSREIYHRGIKGILILLQDARTLPEMDWSKFAVVLVGEEREDLPFFRVRTDWRQVFDLLHAKLGHGPGRRMGFCFRDSAGPGFNRQILAEILLRQYEYGQTGEPSAFLPLAGDKRVSGRAVCSWLRHENVKAIVTNDVEVALVGREKLGGKVAVVPLTDAALESGLGGVDIQFGERLTTGLRQLHELCISETLGLAPQRTKILCPGVWRGEGGRSEV